MLHPIDRPTGPYHVQELESFMVFCILDRAQPYDKVCKAFDALKWRRLTTRAALRLSTRQEISNILKQVGYRFPNQTARFLHLFGFNPVDLEHSSRDELAERILGIGPKLASMFCRNTRGEKYAVLDVHIKRWLAERGYPPNLTYVELEAAFFQEARKLSKDPRELDLEIWEARRVKSRT